MEKGAERDFRAWNFIMLYVELPLDFQKFLPEYLENQKWTTHKYATPLDFQKFLSEYLEN